MEPSVAFPQADDVLQQRDPCQNKRMCPERMSKGNSHLHTSLHGRQRPRANRAAARRYGNVYPSCLSVPFTSCGYLCRYHVKALAGTSNDACNEEAIIEKTRPKVAVAAIALTWHKSHTARLITGH